MDTTAKTDSTLPHARDLIYLHKWQELAYYFLSLNDHPETQEYIRSQVKGKIPQIAFGHSELVHLCDEYFQKASQNSPSWKTLIRIMDLLTYKSKGDERKRNGYVFEDIFTVNRHVYTDFSWWWDSKGYLRMGFRTGDGYGGIYLVIKEGVPMISDHLPGATRMSSMKVCEFFNEWLKSHGVEDLQCALEPEEPEERSISTEKILEVLSTR